jgi:hypothetical protein
VQRAQALGADWPSATRLALAGILSQLASEPAQAHLLALVVHRAGDPLQRRERELALTLGASLAAGAPGCGPPAEMVAGALWHMVRQALLEDRTQILPALSDHLAYVVLASALGADRAIAALCGTGPQPL